MNVLFLMFLSFSIPFNSNFRYKTIHEINYTKDLIIKDILLKKNNTNNSSTYNP